MTSKDIPLHGQASFFYHTLPVVPRAQNALETLMDNEAQLTIIRACFFGKGVPRSQIPRCTGLDCPVEDTAQHVSDWGSHSIKSSVNTTTFLTLGPTREPPVRRHAVTP